MTQGRPPCDVITIQSSKPHCPVVLLPSHREILWTMLLLGSLINGIHIHMSALVNGIHIHLSLQRCARINEGATVWMSHWLLPLEIQEKSWTFFSKRTCARSVMWQTFQMLVRYKQVKKRANFLSTSIWDVCHQNIHNVDTPSRAHGRVAVNFQVDKGSDLWVHTWENHISNYNAYYMLRKSKDDTCHVNG